MTSKTTFDYEKDSDYFADGQFKIPATVTPYRRGFEFVEWTYSNQNIGNEDINVTVTGNWKLGDFLTLTTTSQYDADAKKLVFNTVITLNMDPSDPDYAKYQAITVKSYGFFYGEHNTTFDNTGASDMLKNYLVNNGEPAINKGDITTDLAITNSGRVFFYGYAYGEELNLNNETVYQAFTKVATNPNRSGAEWIAVDVDGDTYCFVSNVCQHKAN